MANGNTNTQKETPSNPLIQAVEESIGQSGIRIDEAITKLETGVAKTGELTDIITQSMSEAATNAQTVARTKLNADLQEQNNNLDILAASGGAEAQAVAIAELQSQEDKVEELTDRKVEIFNREHTGIGIIDTVINMFGAVGNEVKLKGAELQRDQTINEIQNVTRAQESFVRINSITKKTLNDDAIEANLAIIGQENTIKASEAEIRNVHSNAQAMGNLATMDSRQVSNRFQRVKLEDDKTQRELTKKRQEIQLQQLEFDRERFKVQLPKMQADLEATQLQLEENKFLSPSRRVAAEARFTQQSRDIADLRALQEQQIIMVQRGQSSSGVQPESRELILEGINAGGITGAKYIQFRNIGATPNARIGDTPADVVNVLNLVDPSGTSTKTKGKATLELIKIKQAEKYQAAAAKGQRPPKDQGQLDADFNTTAKEIMEEYSDNIVPTDNSNPYAAPPMESLAPMLEFKNIPLYDKVIKPMGFTEVDPQRIVDAAVSAVQAKSITPEQAASGIISIFETAAQFNNEEHGGLTRVGLPPQTSYNTMVAFPADVSDLHTPIGMSVTASAISGVVKSLDVIPELLFTPNKIVDMTDIIQVQELVVRTLSKAKPLNPATPTDTPNSPAPKTIQEPGN